MEWRHGSFPCPGLNVPHTACWGAGEDTQTRSGGTISDALLLKIGHYTISYSEKSLKSISHRGTPTEKWHKDHVSVVLVVKVGAMMGKHLRNLLKVF